jgi:hypothetical protein
MRFDPFENFDGKRQCTTAVLARDWWFGVVCDRIEEGGYLGAQRLNITDLQTIDRDAEERM